MFNVGELFLSDTWPDPGKYWTPLTPIDFSKCWGHSWDQPIGLVSEVAAKGSFCIQARVSNAVKPENEQVLLEESLNFYFPFWHWNGQSLHRVDIAVLQDFAFCLFSSNASDCPLASFSGQDEGRGILQTHLPFLLSSPCFLYFQINPTGSLSPLP